MSVNFSHKNIFRYDSAGKANALVSPGGQINYIAPFAFDSSGNVIGLVGPSGTIPLAGVSAEGFGASPSATAAVNTAAIQAALNRTGLVTLTTPGTYLINATLIIPAYTDFRVGAGAIVKLAPGSNVNILRNTNWGSTANSVTQASTPDLGITANFTASILPAVGSYVIILGASPRVYNGCYRVLTSGAGAFTGAMSTRLAPTETITTPATGTITWMQADSGISISGEFDYDSANQTTPNTWQTFGLYLRRLHNFKADVIVRNTTKYAFAVGNVYDSNIARAEFQTGSDGLHFIGSWDNVNVGVVQGVTGDDMCVFGHSDITQYLDSAHQNGDGGVASIGSIMADGSLSAFKYYGIATQTAKSFVVGSVQGRIAGGSAYVKLVNDPSVVGATSSTLENFELGSLTPAEAISVTGVEFSGAITVTNAKIGSIRATLNDSATARPVQVNNSTTVVSSLSIDDLELSASAYAATSFGIYNQGTISDLNVGRFYAKNIGICIFEAGTALAGRRNIGIFDINTCAKAYRDVSATSHDIYIGHMSNITAQQSPVIDFSNSAGGNTLRCPSAFGMTGTSAFGGSNNSKTPVFCPQIGVNVAGAGMTKTLGAMVYNSTAASIPGTGLVVSDGTTWRVVSMKVQAVASSATPALDCNLGTNVTFTATAASLWGAPTNVPAAGERVTITITQDGTGGWAITWNAAYIFPTAWTNVGNTANQVSEITFVSNGTKLVAQGANLWHA